MSFSAGQATGSYPLWLVGFCGRVPRDCSFGNLHLDAIFHFLLNLFDGCRSPLSLRRPRADITDMIVRRGIILLTDEREVGDRRR
jgi:hypothetical protein